jgi:hypothetical protein
VSAADTEEARRRLRQAQPNASMRDICGAGQIDAYEGLVTSHRQCGGAAVRRVHRHEAAVGYLWVDHDAVVPDESVLVDRPVNVTTRDEVSNLVVGRRGELPLLVAGEARHLDTCRVVIVIAGQRGGWGCER